MPGEARDGSAGGWSLAGDVVVRPGDECLVRFQLALPADRVLVEPIDHKIVVRSVRIDGRLVWRHLWLEDGYGRWIVVRPRSAPLQYAIVEVGARRPTPLRLILWARDDETGATIGEAVGFPAGRPGTASFSKFIAERARKNRIRTR